MWNRNELEELKYQKRGFFSPQLRKYREILKMRKNWRTNEKKMLQSHLICAVDLWNERKQKTLMAIFFAMFSFVNKTQKDFETFQTKIFFCQKPENLIFCHVWVVPWIREKDYAKDDRKQEGFPHNLTVLGRKLFIKIFSLIFCALFQKNDKKSSQKKIVCVCFL